MTTSLLLQHTVQSTSTQFDRLRTQTRPTSSSLPPDTGEHATVGSLFRVLILRCASSHFTRQPVELADSPARARSPLQ